LHFIFQLCHPHVNRFKNFGEIALAMDVASPSAPWEAIVRKQAPVRESHQSLKISAVGQASAACTQHQQESCSSAMLWQIADNDQGQC